MKLQRVITTIMMIVASLVLFTDSACAQIYTRTSQRGNIRQINQGGLVPIDSAALRREQAEAAARRDSTYLGIIDSIAKSTNRDYASMSEKSRDSLHKAIASRMHRDSVAMSKGDSIAPDGRIIRFNKHGEERTKFRMDSMGLSQMCWLSLPLPGFGQIYNKQYWKLGVLYPMVAASTTMFALEHKKYKPLKAEYDQYLIDNGYFRTPELDELQTKLIRHNTRQQIYAGIAIATYIYFIGDAAVNYSTNEVSDIKKATTLSTICPGAGQIYNKSYWRVPIVIGGLASTIYTIDWNNRGYQRFKTAYNICADYELHKNDPTSTKYIDENGKLMPCPDEFQGRYGTSFLKNLKDSYRRNRDLCILLTAGVYILNIIDAHVDAHLKDFDISDDLAMDIEPFFGTTSVDTKPAFGLNLSVKF
jgi:hypothetical protein